MLYNQFEGVLGVSKQPIVLTGCQCQSIYPAIPNCQGGCIRHLNEALACEVKSIQNHVSAIAVNQELLSDLRLFHTYTS